MTVAQGLGLAVLGLSVGTVGALAGVGGGFLLVPVLLFIFPDADPASVTAISLTSVLFTAASASVGFRLSRLQDFRTAGILIVLAVPAAAGGALLNRVTDRSAFETIFAVALLLGAAYLIARSAIESQSEEPSSRGMARTIVEKTGYVHSYRVNEPLTAAIAPVAGFFAGFFGIGGGVMNVPIMMLVIRIPKAVAVATSQLELTAAATAALAIHLAFSSDEGSLWLRAGITGVGAMLGAQIGVRLAPRVSGRLVLGVIGAGLLIAGARLLL
ncbi:MAG: sulfite exporter TauE/SafE family protein [Chloroflexota bacterium]|nr:sulfite exporter TauE/SafE family protein [Chloroflexota bacterium]MDE2886503.1 sulfite exporter TauE/SafE family protein [Chloroflexota bacterium]